MTEALFRNAHEALIFAYNYADQQFAEGIMKRVFNNPCGSGKGLIGLDGAGEAGMIMADVMRLTQSEQDVLCIKYTKVKGLCKCCGGQTHLPAVQDALSRIELFIKTAHYHKNDRENKSIQGVIDTLNLQLIRAIINDFFGLTSYGTLVDLANQYNIHRSTVCRYSGFIKTALRQLCYKAERNIENLLIASGKVNHEEY